MDEPKLIEGGASFDVRGSLVYNNTFDMSDVRRFYLVENNKQGQIRAWHGHKKEAKYVTIIHGTAKFGVARVKDWENGIIDEINHYTLSASNPQILYIPAGHINGFMTLTSGALVMFFSTTTLEESKGDDYRFDAYKFDIWTIGAY